MANALAGKKAIITAAANGIGAVVARNCVAAGASVSVCDIDEKSLEVLKKTAPEIDAHSCNVADPSAVSGFIQAAVDRLGGVDILINNAGTAGPTANAENIAPADWNATIAVNLSAQFYCASLVIPHLKAAGGGSIVNMSSSAGRLGFPMRTPYAAAKWGVIGLTQTLAMELGPHGIRVNAILPGPVIGERMDRVFREKSERTGISVAELRADEIKNISLRTMIDPQEIADLIVFICSDSGRSISGQSLGICGNTETLR